MDITLVANEIVEECRKKKKRFVIVKVDYEKAYDSVNWDFLYYMMNRLGFCNRWIDCIKECSSSSSISVLVNRSPTKEFIPMRSFRQGDEGLTPSKDGGTCLRRLSMFRKEVH